MCFGLQNGLLLDFCFGCVFSEAIFGSGTWETWADTLVPTEPEESLVLDPPRQCNSGEPVTGGAAVGRVFFVCGWCCCWCGVVGVLFLLVVLFLFLLLLLLQLIVLFLFSTSMYGSVGILAHERSLEGPRVRAAPSLLSHCCCSDGIRLGVLDTDGQLGGWLRDACRAAAQGQAAAQGTPGEH